MSTRKQPMWWQKLDKSILIFLCLLLSADILFLILHCLWVLGFGEENILLSVETDRGYSEIFQYVKTFWVVTMLAFIGVYQRRRSYFTWALLFLYILLDDSLSIHENLGSHIATSFGFQPLLIRAQDFGELTVYASVFVIFIVAFWLTYRRASSQFRQDSRTLAVMLAVLAVFGAGVDMVHIALLQLPSSFFRYLLMNAFALIEDGGEMLTMSLICCYVFVRSQQSERDKALTWSRPQTRMHY